MTQNIGTKINYLMIGLGLGSALAILFAPKSGQETREDLARGTRRTIRDLRERAEDISYAGRHAYRRIKKSMAAA